MSEARSSRGRRVAAPPPRKGLDRTALVAAVLVAVAAVAVLVAARDAPTPAPEESAPATEPVDHVVNACPRTTERSRVATGSAPVKGLGSEGGVRFGPPEQLADAKEKPLRRGELRDLDPGSGKAPTVAVEADGEIAAGLFTFQVDADAGALAAGECASPQARWWFTGAGATIDHTSELVLSNVDPGPAVVNVRVLGPGGEADTASSTYGLTVKPGETLELPLVDVTPQEDELAVGVETTRGRVVAAMSESFASEAGGASGSEWLPGQTEPGRSLRLAGLPEQAESRTLFLANPSGREALVDLEVSGETGSFAPTGAAQIRVPPGSVTATDVTAVVGREPSAVTLRSNTPVTASLRSTAGGDASYAAPVLPLTGPAAAPVADGATSTVLLSAVSGPASADVAAYDERGKRVDSKSLEMDAGATSAWRADRRASYLVVTPRDGQVFGAVSLTGAGTSQVPLRSLPVELERPSVQPALG